MRKLLKIRLERVVVASDVVEDGRHTGKSKKDSEHYIVKSINGSHEVEVYGNKYRPGDCIPEKEIAGVFSQYRDVTVTD